LIVTTINIGIGSDVLDMTIITREKTSSTEVFDSQEIMQKLQPLNPVTSNTEVFDS
jgi:hypothetical protein